jgi:CHAT domain-containing protein
MQALRIQSATISNDDSFDDFEMYALRYRIRNLRSQIAALSVAAVSDAATIDSLTAQKETVERSVLRVRKRIPDPVSDSTLTAFQSLLRPDEVLVDLYRYSVPGNETGNQNDIREARYGAAIVGRDSTRVQWIELGDAASIDAAVGAWREAVTRGNFGATELDVLAQAVWDPIVSALEAAGIETSRMWVSPDGALARLPWSVVAEQRNKTADLLISVVDSPREFARIRTTERKILSRQGERALFLVGDVDFDSGGGSQTGASAASTRATIFTPLPGTRTEIDRLHRVARAQRLPAHVVSGPDATRAVVSDRLLDARYAHIATHGFFFRETDEAYATRGAKKTATMTDRAYPRNPLIESGLALAGANANSDGLFTAEEMIGLDLSGTELVVLSACDTGRGTEITGQGVMGLRAALTAAGVRAMLMSLWKVPDESTAILMESFYRGLLVDGLLPVEALRRAQREVRENPLFAEPIHWAAWILAGEVW